MKIRNLLLALSAVGAMPAAGQAAVAVSAGEEPAIAVSYADLNLTSAEGQHRLQVRLKRAAQDYCAAHNPGDIGRISAGHDCVAGLLAKAQSKYAQAIAEANSRLAGAGQPVQGSSR